MTLNHPCLSCGACCAFYRVSFYWREASANGIPAQLTVPVTPHRLAMRGTTGQPARCAALLGEVGDCVQCSIYAARPAPCRDVQPSWQAGAADEQCDKARQAWGLPPLQPPQASPPPPLPPGDLPHAA